MKPLASIVLVLVMLWAFLLLYDGLLLSRCKQSGWDTMIRISGATYCGKKMAGVDWYIPIERVP